MDGKSIIDYINLPFYGLVLATCYETSSAYRSDHWTIFSARVSCKPKEESRAFPLQKRWLVDELKLGAGRSPL